VISITLNMARYSTTKIKFLSHSKTCLFLTKTKDLKLFRKVTDVVKRNKIRNTKKKYIDFLPTFVQDATYKITF
jgi:hypothetical protein